MKGIKGIKSKKYKTFIFPHIHIWKNEYSSSLYDEGVDKFHRCIICGETKIKYMWER